MQVQGPDGVVIEFPDGTPPETIKAAMAKKFGAPSQPAQPQQGYLSGMLDSVTQGAAMGFGDELTGLESAVLGKTPDGGMFDYSQPFGERYSRAVAAERGQQDAFAESNPVSSTVAEVAGALGTGVGAGRAGLTLMGRKGIPAVAGAAAEGAAYGGIYGAGEADEGDRLEGAAYGGAVGGLAGGAVAGVTQQIAKILAGRKAATQAPSVQQLKGMAGVAYDRARAVNPTFDGFDQFASQAYQTLADEGFNVRFHPQLGAVLDDIEQITRGGTAPDFKTLEQLRRRFEAAAGANTTNADQARLARMGKRALDSFMEASATKAASNPGNLPALPGQGVSTAQREALADVGEGRALYSRAKKGELIDRMFEKALDRAGSTNSGANVENTIRQNMRQILDNPKLSRGFSKQEIEAIRNYVRGDTMQNAFRKLGSMSPLRGGVMSLMSGGTLGAGVMTGNPLMMALPATAAVADALSVRGGMSQANAISSMVRGGPNAAATLNSTRQLSPTVQAVIKALAGQGGGAAGAITQP